MAPFISKYIEKLFFKKWIIGITKGDIREIIRTKKFNPDINWLMKESIETYYADPFLFSTADGKIKILLEEFPFEEDYGKISMMTLDEKFNLLNYKGLLDSKSHLSYPFMVTENNKTYMFPEAGQSGKLSCYEFDPINESVSFVKDIIDLPLRDSSIFKQNGKYWIFGTLTETGNHDYRLHVFYSENLLGPYTAHTGNPVKMGIDGTRPAGNFIEVDGDIYRPAQNCKKQYGDSMTINKIIELSEYKVVEEPYFTITINSKNKHNRGMKTIHTINEMNGFIVVDGIKWTFSPVIQLKTFLRNRKIARHIED